ncbi:hypothetical protein C7T96_23750 [Nitratireductor sp. StC3]|nr:hypothetical protein C7T96_23750 [Nitratireductor sp. StC3]
MRAESSASKIESTARHWQRGRVAGAPGAPQADPAGCGHSFLLPTGACVLIDGAVFSISRAGESRGEVAEWSKALPC